MPSRKSHFRHRNHRGQPQTKPTQMITSFGSGTVTTAKMWPPNAEFSFHDEIEFYGERNGLASYWPGEVWDVFERDGRLVYEVTVDNLGDDSLSEWHVYHDGNDWVGTHIRDSDYTDD